MKTKKSNTTRIIGWIVSVVLLSAAVFTIWNRWEDLSKAIDSVERPNAGVLLSLVIITILSQGFVCESFRLLLNRVGIAKKGSIPIEKGEMFWLVMVSGMLNWLPMRAGLIGRTVYHSKVNGIPAHKSLQVLFESVTIIVGVSGVALLMTLVSNLFKVQILYLGCLPIMLSCVFVAQKSTRRWSLAIIYRYFDLLLFATRYWLIFDLMSYEITPETAILLAGAGSIASLLPLPTGGLGGREWVIGLVAAWVTVFPSAIALGLIADLINRVVELTVVIPFGFIGQHLLRKKLSMR
jgi:uncharacterized membrane protein YbhN (UPF0104 family)